MEAKLLFYRSIGIQINPYLTLYQTDKPMMPFMSADLFDLLKNVMGRVIKPEVMTTASTALKICEIIITESGNQLDYKR